MARYYRAGLGGTRFRAFASTVRAQFDQMVSPAARQQLIADAANRILADAQAINAAALGRVPDHDTFVDGRPTTQLTLVNPDRGEILFRFKLASEMFEWIDAQLVLHSPVLTTRYARSHVLFSDGAETDPLAPKEGDQFIFLNVQPYARKIEGSDNRKPQSSMAPNGVYEVVAALANRRFGNLAQIRFGYRAWSDGAVIYNPNKFALRSQLQQAGGLSDSEARAAASKLIKTERDKRQPAIIIDIR